MEETDRITHGLREELLETEITDAAVLDAEQIPEGALGIAVLVGWLAVQLGAVRRLTKVVATAVDFATRFNRTIEVTIDGDVLKVKGPSTAAQDLLIAAFIARHAGND